jgi:hypothetical protein
MVRAAIACVVLLSCVPRPMTPYEKAFRSVGPEHIGVGMHMITVRVNENTSESLLKEYLVRKGNELCPQGWTTSAEWDDLEIDDDGDDDDKVKTIDVNCK